MATLQDFDIFVRIEDGPTREEMFDSNRLPELDLVRDFRFAIADNSKKLTFYSFSGAKMKSNYVNDVVVKGRILCAEPRDKSGKNWKVKVELSVPLIESIRGGHSYSTERVIIWIDYNTSQRMGRPISMKSFIEKCVRYHDRSDKNNPNGLWFTRHVAWLPGI